MPVQLGATATGAGGIDFIAMLAASAGAPQNGTTPMVATKGFFI